MIFLLLFHLRRNIVSIVLRERINGPMSIIPQQIACDTPNCGSVRTPTNHWYVVLADDSGVHIYRWANVSQKAMRTGRHFCGVAHAIQYASSVLTPDTTNMKRESTLELKPPLTRDGAESPAEPTVQ